MKVVFTTVEVSDAEKDSKRRFSHRGRLLMLVKACLSTVKVCKHSLHHCRSLLKDVLTCLSAGKDSKRRFSHRGRLLMLVKTC